MDKPTAEEFKQKYLWKHDDWCQLGGEFEGVEGQFLTGQCVGVQYNEEEGIFILEVISSVSNIRWELWGRLEWDRWGNWDLDIMEASVLGLADGLIDVETAQKMFAPGMPWVFDDSAEVVDLDIQTVYTDQYGLVEWLSNAVVTVKQRDGSCPRYQLTWDKEGKLTVSCLD